MDTTHSESLVLLSALLLVSPDHLVPRLASWLIQYSCPTALVNWGQWLICSRDPSNTILISHQSMPKFQKFYLCKQPHPNSIHTSHQVCPRPWNNCRGLSNNPSLQTHQARFDRRILNLY